VDLEAGIIAEIVKRELAKEGVGEIQALRIGKLIAKALEIRHGRHAVTD
jgi:hypothetical protein